MNANPKLPEKKSEKQNLTIQLDKSVIRLAKILAASEGLSVSSLVARLVEGATAGHSELERIEATLDKLTYEEAKQRAKQLMEQGIDYHPGRYVPREALYDRYFR